MGLKTHSTNISTQFDEEISWDENKHFRYLVNYKFHSYEDRSSDEYPADDGPFLSTPEDTGRHYPSPDFNVIRQHSRLTFFYHHAPYYIIILKLTLNFYNKYKYNFK